MTGLFTPKLIRSVGYGNAMYLSDLAEGIPTKAMRKKYLNGEYPDLNRKAAPEWSRLAGRTDRGTK